MKNTIITSFLLISLVAVLLLSINPTNQSQNQFTHISYDLCQHKRLIDIALSHGADYLLDETFDAPATSIMANKHTAKLIKDKFNQSANRPYLSKHCHLPNIKYHVTHVNHRLTTFIPDDADHVSYAPPHIKQDKAVYCYYYFDEQRFNTPKAISTCYFIHLKNGQLLKDDISDLERLNLKNITPRPSAFFNPFSHVANWHDSDHLRYGMTFITKVNNQSVGHGDVY